MKYATEHNNAAAARGREFIICALGTGGDIYPLVNFGRSLEERGNTVTFLSNEKFRSAIEADGLKFASIGTRKEYDDFYGDKRAWDVNSNPAELAFERYYGPSFRRSFDYVKERFARNPNLIVIGLSLLNGARAAAKKLGAPYVLISLSPSLIPSRACPPIPMRLAAPEWMPDWLKKYYYGFRMYMIDRYLTRRGYISKLNDKRKALGLAPVKKFFRHEYGNEDLHIGFFPEWFGMRPADWPQTLKLVGFPLGKNKTESMSRQVDQFIKKCGAPVLFTSGTGFYDTEQFFTESIRACERLSVPCLLVGGRKPEYQRNTDIDVLHVEFADFECVFQRCSVVVHHGGMGTLSHAINAGVPQLIRPIMYDQPDNAYRVTELRLGLPVLESLYSAENVASKLRQLMHESVKKRALFFSCRIRKDRSLKRACDLVMNL